MNPTPRQEQQQPQASSATSKNKPGRMTAVMRTLAAPGLAHGPRIPRVAVVRGGRIIDEILVKDGASQGVTIGTSEKARIVVRAAVQLPQIFQLIERAGNRYWLRFTDAMNGRVSGVDGISSLADLRGQAQTQLIGDGTYRVALADDARGKVSLGDTTFLFQIVAPPPPALRPQLPISVKHGLGLDWGLTIIAAFSFLLHFGIAGAMYSDWLDPIVATDHVTAGLVELNRLPKAPPEIPPDPTTIDPTNPTTPTHTPVANNTPANNNNNNNTKTKTTSSHTNTTSRSTSDSEAATLVARAEQLQIDYLTVKANGSAVKETLDRTAVPPVDLSSAAEKNIGVSHDSKGDLRVATGGPVTTGKNNLPGIVGNNTHSNSNTTAGPETNTAGPAITVGTSPAQVNGAPISDADIAIAKLKSRFKKCYQDGLNQNPTMSGKAVLSAKVGPNGEVIGTDVVSNEGLSPTVTSCLSNAVTKYAQFTGNGAVTTVRIPVSLVHQ